MKKVIRAAKGTPEQFLEALENRLDELQASKDLEIDECDDIYSNDIEATTEEDKYQFIDWLATHDQAYQDAEDFFGKNLEEVSWDDLIAWLSEHEVLLDDYMRHFGKSALIDDELIDDMSEEEEVIDVYV